MKIALLNIDKFVTVNDLKEVSNPIILERGFVPSMDGLLSTEIFGSNITDRRMTFGYIELNTHLLQPLVYITLKRMNKYIDDIILGNKYFSIDKTGEIVEDPNGKTGIDWLYDNWNKIKLKKNESTIRGERVDFIYEHSRDELFCSKWIVCPPFYRDINLQSSKSGRPSIHKFNYPYTKLMRLASMLNQSNFIFSLNNTKYHMQQCLVTIYNQFKGQIEKKRGVIRNNLLSKSVDYGSRVVISTAKATYNRMEDMLTTFYHTGIPLSFCISAFTPFFVGWIQNFIRNELELTGYKYPLYDPKTKSVSYVELEEDQYTDDDIKKMMNKYIHSYNERFDPITIKTKDENDPIIHMAFRGRVLDDKTFDPNENPIANRPMTLTDLMYLAVVDITKDKHVYITRYPIADYKSIFPTKIAVVTTNETEKIELDGKVYTHYPKIDLSIDKSEVGTRFIEVVQMTNVYLEAIGGKVKLLPNLLNCGKLLLGLIYL